MNKYLKMGAILYRHHSIMVNGHCVSAGSQIELASVGTIVWNRSHYENLLFFYNMSSITCERG